MPSNITLLFLFVFIFAVCLSGNGVYAFGAGNIPGFAYMEGKAFRHGDIEDALTDLLKRVGGGFALSSMLGSKGPKFGGLDVKRVYFGNWLRDYSQAMDIASLKKLQPQTIINLCMALGFLAHGYATNEFEVTEERLGVYLPIEHIDNPKGYGEGEDARRYHPKLRGPVDPRELEIDPHTGMKNYIANETGNWDTSKALVRRLLEQCIQLGRQHRSQGRKQDEYEAYRLLGTALHTLEDFAAHSNFCELSLVSLGHTDVFVHVGDQVRIQAPNGKWVAPIVTGTFGSSDFIHSLLGEATDHISEASVSDLNKELEKARSISNSQTSRSGPGSSSPADTLRDLLFKIPGGSGSEMSREMDGIERIRAGPAQGGKRPEDMSPQELHAVLWQVLSFRDSVVKKISKTIEKIPGLGPMIEKLMESIQVFVFTTLEPFLKPIMKTATTGLQSASSEVIDTHDQYEVFNDPRASDPTHSFLSKDHFNLILNEPAGKLARIILIHTVNLVIKAWDDASINARGVADDVLKCLFHPDFHDSNSKIQREMMQFMNTWVQQLGANRDNVLRRLSKNAVRNHENTRLGGEGGKPAAQGTFAYNEGVQVQHNLQGYAAQIPGVAQAQSIYNSFSGGGSGLGMKREAGLPDPGVAAGYPGAAHGHHDHGSYAPPSSSGQSASYYNESGHNAPSFPGSGGGSSYAPPSGPPPSFPGSTSQQSSYASSYSPSYPSSAPSFPGGPDFSMPSFPDAGGYSSYGPPPGPPPGGFPGGPPGSGFPGADPYSHHGHNGHHGHGPPPQFPGAPGEGYPPPNGPPYGGPRPPGW